MSSRGDRPALHKRMVHVPDDLRKAVLRFCTVDGRILGRLHMARRLGISETTVPELVEQGGVVTARILEKVKARILERTALPITSGETR